MTHAPWHSGAGTFSGAHPDFTGSYSGADTSNQPDWAGSGQGQGPPGQPATGPHIGYEPSPVATIEEVINQPIIDVAAEQDAIDDADAIAAVNPVSISHHPTEGVVQHNPNFTPHDQLYGANQAGVIPGQTVYATTNIDPNSNMYLALQGMDPNTLAFFGYTLGDTTVSNELLNSVAQGSIVSGNEAVVSTEENIGTWSDVETGNHPLFPGGLQDYHDITGQPFIIPIPPPTSFDEMWYGDVGTPWDQEWYDYPIGDEESIMAQLGTWGAKPLPTESVSMGEMEPIYGAEFGPELMASPIFMGGIESPTGIPYPGKPKFGTIEMDVG